MAKKLTIAILILLFKSYRIPTMLFCCIPLILVGVVPLVYVSGKDFGFVAIIGVLGLVGMVPLLPDALFGSLAVTIIGGPVAGTVTVLLFLPVLYSIFYKVTLFNDLELAEDLLELPNGV